MYANILILVACITVISAVFVLRTKAIGEWSMLVISYGLFLLFVLYWRSGNGTMNNISITLLFFGLICNAFDKYMARFCWDFLFQWNNKGVAMYTWDDIYYHFEDKIDPKQITILKKQLFDDIIRYNIFIKHPVNDGWNYLLNYQATIAVYSGEIKLTYKKDNKELLLQKDDFVIIREKEIYKMESVSDTVFKFTCHKQ